MDLHKRVSVFPDYETLVLSNPVLVDDMLAALTEHKREQATSTRVFKSSHNQDVNSTCSKVEAEVSLLVIYSFPSTDIQYKLIDLAQRRQTASLMVVARTNAMHPNEPYYIVDPISRDFLESIVGMSVHEFYTKFEAFAIAGHKGLANTDNDRRNLLKKSVRQMVRRKLRKSLTSSCISCYVLRYVQVTSQ